MTDDSLVERVARALCRYEIGDDGLWKNFTIAARAVIAAMTSDMTTDNGEATLAASRVADLLRLKNRFDTIFNNVLCDMQPGWDDSIEGFNKAWDISREIFQEEIGKATALALRKDAADVG